MDRPDTIQLLLTDHDIDYQKATCLKPPTGRVIVEMLPETGQIGPILLPDVVAGQFRPDVGIVLAVGPGVSLAPGATVCVRGYDGQWIEGFEAGYRTSNQVRCYGAAAQYQGSMESYPWSDSIPLQIVGEFEMVATDRNVVIRRDPVVESESGFLLPDSAKYRTGKATVVSVGPCACLDIDGGRVSPGDRVVYDPRGELDFAFGGDPDLAIITDVAICCVYE